MPLTLWNGVCLCFLLVILSTVLCSSSNVNTTCSAKPAEEGQLSVINLYFHGINFSADQFYIVLVKDTKNILHCGDVVTKAAHNCTISHGSFELAGTADRNMTVIIPVATHDLRGIYILQTHVNGLFVSPTSCEFVIYQASDTAMGTHNSTPTPAAVVKGPEVVTVVVPVLVMMVVIIIIIVVLFRHRESVRNCVGRKRHHDYVATDETDTMTDSEHRTESS